MLKKTYRKRPRERRRLSKLRVGNTTLIVGYPKLGSHYFGLASFVTKQQQQKEILKSEGQNFILVVHMFDMSGESINWERRTYSSQVSEELKPPPVSSSSSTKYQNIAWEEEEG